MSRLGIRSVDAISDFPCAGGLGSENGPDGALLPRLNPFDAAYNAFIALRRGLPLLTWAPGPRRFAQATAATLALAVTGSLLAGERALALGIELFLLAAIAALVLGSQLIGAVPVARWHER